ncbi:hypothetical protein E6W39_24140 [Kitasatospora acidiphila]|uniref:DUF3618 domain-containing protein n=1 Tax=Kitasatospora acidiphila TaxID=2567942 RepID=A0A540W703_9ACTN|nr:hypothetical protein [Kitasatospora acidiphila]TQF04747.1 hypothetical protein E6W39_24140 [Kitasatospora acidiphila]
MASPVPEDPATALALERLRGVVGESFAEIKGSLALLVQRSDQHDRALTQHRADTERALDQQRADTADLDQRLGEVERVQAANADVRPRVDALEERRWPLTPIVALAAVLAVVVAMIPLLLR